MENECMICLQPVDENEFITILIQCECKGYYHDKCLSKWFIEKNNIICPVCSKIFPGEYENKQNTNVIILSQPHSPIYEYNYLVRQKKCLFFIAFLFVMYTGFEIRYLLKFLFHK